MKEIFSAFGSEVFRPLVTLVLPGAIALSTWFMAVLQKWPAAKAAVNAKPTEAYVILVSLAVGLGLLVEDLGSQIENFFDKRLEKKTGTHIANWYSYLRHAFEAVPVGEVYLRTLVIRLKFELDTSVAAVLAAIGTFFLATPGSVGVWLPLALIVLAAYLFFEAWTTCTVLSRLRGELIKGVTVVK